MTHEHFCPLCGQTFECEGGECAARSVEICGPCEIEIELTDDL